LRSHPPINVGSPCSFTDFPLFHLAGSNPASHQDGVTRAAAETVTGGDPRDGEKTSPLVRCGSGTDAGIGSARSLYCVGTGINDGSSPKLTVSHDGATSGREYVAYATHCAQRQRLRKTAVDLAAEAMDQNVQPMGIEIPGLIGQYLDQVRSRYGYSRLIQK